MYGGYRAVFSTIWTEDTGREWNRLGHHFHKVAFYLLTGPLSNAYGLYYLPLAIAQSHTGLSADRLMQVFSVFDGQDFAVYDAAAEWVWVKNMVRYQLFPNKDKVSQADLRLRGVRRFYDTCPPNAHLGPFFERYGEELGLACRREGKVRLPPTTTQKPVRDLEPEGSPEPGTSLARVVRLSKADLFERWWKFYPKKVGKKAALAEWLRIEGVDESFTAKAIATLEWQCRQPEWVKENGQYIPDPERYIKRGRWMDEPRDQVGLTDRDARTANVLAEWASAPITVDAEGREVL